MYKILKAYSHPSPFGEQTVWFVQKNDKCYYISYQSELPTLEGITSEAMAFKWNSENEKPLSWDEVAVCRGYSPDESFVKIIEQLALT